jgi:hypothetical protein
MYITKEEAIKQGVGRHFGLCPFHNSHPDQEGIKNCQSCRVVIDPCGCNENMGCSRCETKPVKKFISEMKEDSFGAAVREFKWRREKKEITYNYSHSDRFFDRKNKKKK